MRDYGNTAKALRCCRLTSERGCAECPFSLNSNEKCANLLPDAADAIEELSQMVAHYKQNSDDWFREACEYKAQIPHWISVEERLPEPGERVLVSNGGFVCESFLSQSGKWQRGGMDMFFMTPTHWMPLPSAPKGVE